MKIVIAPISLKYWGLDILLITLMIWHGKILDKHSMKEATLDQIFAK